MHNSASVLKPPLPSRTVAGLIVVALSAACDSPTQPSGPEPGRTDPSGARADLGGTDTLILSTSSGCRLDLPEDLRSRTYTATIVQEGNSLTVMVQYPSPHSWGQPDRFTGRVGGTNEVVFQLGVEEWWLGGGDRVPRVRQHYEHDRRRWTLRTSGWRDDGDRERRRRPGQPGRHLHGAGPRRCVFAITAVSRDGAITARVCSA